MKELKDAIREVKYMMSDNWDINKWRETNSAIETLLSFCERVVKKCEGMPKFHKTKDFGSLLKFTNCAHEVKDELTNDCPACNMAWCIGRIKILEKTIDEILIWHAKEMKKKVTIPRQEDDIQGRE